MTHSDHLDLVLGRKCNCNLLNASHLRLSFSPKIACPVPHPQSHPNTHVKNQISSHTVAFQTRRLRNWWVVQLRPRWGARPPRALFSAPSRKTPFALKSPPVVPGFVRPNCWTRGRVPRRPRGARPPRAQRRTPSSAATSASARAGIRSIFPAPRPPLRELEALKAFTGRICCQRTRISSLAKRATAIGVVWIEWARLPTKSGWGRLVPTTCRRLVPPPCGFAVQR